MINSWKVDHLTAHAVGNYIGRAGNDEFTGAGNPSDPSRGRVGRKLSGARFDPLDQTARGVGIVVGDVERRFVEVAESSQQPSNAHRAATSS